MVRAAVRIGFAVLMLAVCLAELLAPHTKVEESFNMQALHDFFFAANSDEFDHHLFPGVVPRTFTGAWVVSVLTLTPFAVFLEPLWNAVMPHDATGGADTADSWLHSHPKLLSHACRGVLGGLVLWSLWGVATALADDNDRGPEPKERADATGAVQRRRRRREWTALFFCLLCAGQFHICFYATRPLPNTYGLLLANAALAQTLRGRLRAGVAFLSVAAALFRCDVLALLAPYGLDVTFTAAAAPSSSARTARKAVWYPLRWLFWLLVGVTVGITVVALGVSVTALGIDSLLWRRWLWPEGEVLLFNTAENKSSEWGTFPADWYWTRALPRALLCAYPLVLWLAAVTLCQLVGTALTAVGVGRKAGQVDATKDRSRRGGGAQRVDTASSTSFTRFFFTSSWRVARTYRGVLMPALTFVALYSALPHKELRFILVVFPWLLVPMAAWLAELWLWPYADVSAATVTTHTARRAIGAARPGLGARLCRWLVRSSVCVGFLFLFATCGVSVLISAVNYPGGTALRRLEAVIAADAATAAYLSPPTRPVTVFVDAYAAMSGINRFQKSFFDGHTPLFTAFTHTADDTRRSQLRHPLWTRWKALVTLPMEALIWRASACLGPVADVLPLAAETMRRAAGRSMCGSLDATSVTCPAMSGSGGDEASCTVTFATPTTPATTNAFVRYLKDPSLFLTAAEVRAAAVAAQHGRAGPSGEALVTRHSAPPVESPSKTTAEGAVYKPEGIDYALVRATQWDLHLVDHDTFELLFVQHDEAKRVLADVKAVIRACVSSKHLDVCRHGAQHMFTRAVNILRSSLASLATELPSESVQTAAARPENLSTMELSDVYLLALRRRK